MIWYLILGLAMTGMSVTVVVRGGGVAGWFGSLFFGLCSAIFAVQLVPAAAYLRLMPEGFVACSLFRKWPLIRWDTVSEFRVAMIPPSGARIVVFDWDGASKPFLRKVNRVLVGAGAGLPDTYGLRPQQLADLMNDWRRRATQ